MKKVFAVIITITLFVGSFALAETVDLSQYKDAELISLLEAVQQEIANRHIERSADLPQGSYLVGKDTLFRLSPTFSAMASTLAPSAFRRMILARFMICA